MLEKKINLEEIITQSNRRAFDEEGYNNYFTVTQRNIIRKAMLEFGKQLLELASENAELIFLGESDSDGMGVDKQSILNTIKQVE